MAGGLGRDSLGEDFKVAAGLFQGLVTAGPPTESTSSFLSSSVSRSFLLIGS